MLDTRHLKSALVLIESRNFRKKFDLIKKSEFGFRSSIIPAHIEPHLDFRSRCLSFVRAF